ncbi:hypothetical protein BD626DRAFT_499521 [Schizophyllum amplum]|uniref:Uncharacterized protein n=1 Tax=Schizophyllum amplum TaxID=97359 RepID=A0A550CB51_9AGAR|nr:hypothetical protein BD626DRAFT_499521 [Auriculariopsis ampla]
MAAPPSYSAATSLGQPSQPSGSRIRKLRFAEIPPHLLLNVVYATLPQTPGVDESAVERQRRVLYWMSMNLRLVNRPFYVACMHVLRSIYLRTYERLIRPPYTSDPFPVLSPAPSYEESTSDKPPAASLLSPTATSSALLTPFPDTLPRETRVLDQFIALKVREDAWADATSLHLERDEGYKDLFDLMQPRARVEDLICQYAVREGIVSFAGSSRPASPTGSTSELSRHPRPIPFRLLTVTFSPWRVGLAITLSSRRKTIVEVQRGARDESLERAAKRVVRELRVWAAENWR